MLVSLSYRKHVQKIILTTIDHVLNALATPSASIYSASAKRRFFERLLFNKKEIAASLNGKKYKEAENDSKKMAPPVETERPLTIACHMKTQN
ncbi:hypothetical protein [Segetibacter koreensis]|uniref:hypothetical protein n=1 Tax=Segetibacter koreensis TaxID=398037 RepID=UPI00037C01F2|nr:hypothetical protein [Segetibacter koreensis]